MQRVAFVTGSSRGIGYGILKKFAENGYRVVMSGSSGEEKAKKNLDELRDAGHDIAYIRCDVSADADRRATYAEISRRYGRLDVLVNNAGVAPKNRLNILETTEESFDRV
ncbi:MAG: SDR family NAD(P)-dependent oxidoreductase, partial [Synergistaceae bacterium]|nr:SDR family NAD(P)-dependent oxidoreductase [Synergistaceae bacterium]